MTKAHPVDELLAMTAAKTDPPSADEIPVDVATGVYDVSFFRTAKTSLDHLEDARVGLGLFIEETQQALEKDGLTVDQRLHAATILTYIEGLAKRLDVIRTPGFTHTKKR